MAKIDQRATFTQKVRKEKERAQNIFTAMENNVKCCYNKTILKKVDAD